MPVWTEAGRCRSRLVLALNDWWCSKGGPPVVPDRSAVDPGELKGLLPHILIAEAEHDPFRVKYRLQGTKVTEITGLDITGHYLDELLSAEPDQPWEDHYLTVYRSRRPLFGLTTVPRSAGGTVDYEFGIFPLRHGGEPIAQFIALEDYFGLVGRIDQIEPWRVSPATRPPA
jgi:hypothetical protein